jgi:hypothetical protein
MEFQPRVSTNPEEQLAYTVGTYKLPLKYMRLQYTTLTPSQANSLDTLEYEGFYFRKSRGDGNCWYRAVYVLYLEELIRNNRLTTFID